MRHRHLCTCTYLHLVYSYVLGRAVALGTSSLITHPRAQGNETRYPSYPVSLLQVAYRTRTYMAIQFTSNATTDTELFSFLILDSYSYI